MIQKWIQIIESSVDEHNQTAMIKYPTLEQLLTEMWQCPIEDLQKSEHGGIDQNGNEHLMSFEEMVLNIKQMGCYGFAKDKSIHFWADTKTVDPSDFIGMIAHEKGHLTQPEIEDDMQEEIKAERFNDVAKFAFEVYRRVS